MGAPPRGLPKLLHAGATVHVRSVHPDAADEYEFRLRADDASELDCLTPELLKDTFRGVFLPEALARGDALLAVTQTSPDARKDDGEYHGADRPRGYTLEQVSRTIEVAGTQRSITVARYQGDDRIIGAVLEVEPESKLVLLISRGDGEFAMNLVKIR